MTKYFLIELIHYIYSISLSLSPCKYAINAKITIMIIIYTCDDIFCFVLHRKISTHLFKDQVSWHNISHSQQYINWCYKNKLATFLAIILTYLSIFTFIFLHTLNISFNTLFCSYLFAEHIAHILFLKGCWIDLGWFYFNHFFLRETQSDFHHLG